MKAGTLVALVTAVLVSCSSSHLSSGTDDRQGTAGAGGSRTNPPPAAGDTGSAGAPGGLLGSGGSGAIDGGPDVWRILPPATLSISAREALTRVARVLWEAPPDPSLLAMADAGALRTDVDVQGFASLMLGDPRARLGVGHFYRWWLGLDALQSVSKDASLFPEYSTAVGAMMAEETETFGVAITLDGDGRYPTLMTAPYSFINETLAPFYGVTGVTGAELRQVDLDPARRAGLFTQLAVLTRNSGQDGWTAPPTRGTEVVNRALCLNVPREPPGTPPLHPDPQYTNRELTNRAAGQPACAACHQYVDPVGFAYEGFDSVGRARSMDAGKPIDDSGFVLLDSGKIEFSGPVQLAGILSASPQAHQCMASKWLEYMLGRPLTMDDMASVASITGRFEDAGLDLRTAIAAAASSPSFLAAAGGTPCTPGMDQTCNSDPKISSLHGTCTSDGKCVCGDSYKLDVATGRCL